MTDTRIVRYLRETVRGLPAPPPERQYKLAYDFVLQHGEGFAPAPLPKPYPYRRFRAEKACFRNAGLLAVHHDGLTYVEGYALSGESAGPVLHAWCIESGRVIDPTWQKSVREGAAYFGVRFSRRVLARGFYGGSLIDDWEHGFPLLRQPWKEDES